MNGRTALALLALAHVPTVAYSAPIEIDVPKHTVWCATDLITAQADDGGRQGGLLVLRLTSAIADEARARSLQSIGLAYVAGVARSSKADRPNDFEVTVCAAVPKDAPPPTGRVAARSEPHRKGLADVCDKTGLDSCADALAKAMTEPPWGLDRAALDAATRRDHPALMSDRSAENAVRSLLHSRDVLLGGGVTDDTAPALKSDKVVVAILVDVADAPEK